MKRNIKVMGKFERTSLLIFVISMVANVCGYLFQIITGRILTTEDYGTVNALIAFMSIIVSPTTVLTSTVAKALAEAERDKENDKVSLIYVTSCWVTVMLQVLNALIFLLIIPLLMKLLQISDKLLIVASIFTATVSILTYTASGMLQGMQKYISYGVMSIIINGGKFVLSISFIKFGMNVYGVLLALILSYIVAWIYCMYQMRKYKLTSFSWNDILSCILFWKNYFIKTILIRSTILIVLNADILLVKIYFTEQETGIFSYGMVLAKIGIYMATAIVVPLFPMVVEESHNIKIIKTLFLKAFSYGVGSCVLYSLGMIMVGGPIVNLLFGKSYTETLYLFPYICPYVVGVTGLLIIMDYVLAIGKMKFLTISMIIEVLLSFGISLIYHSKIEMMFIFLDVVILSVLVINVIYLIRDFKG